ncbi:MAG: hypothetical protein JAY82_19185 [Candidatus Thiodiazotropha taylori]|nr:hypothetical protein [Candidatus Thiodiazotropha taylori]
MNARTKPTNNYSARYSHSKQSQLTDSDLGAENILSNIQHVAHESLRPGNGSQVRPCGRLRLLTRLISGIQWIDLGCRSSFLR